MKFVAVLLVLLTGCGGCVSVPSVAPVSPQDATLRLEYVDGGVCSGTAVGRHTVLTATHCQDGAQLWTVNGQVVAVLSQEDDGKDHTLLQVSIEFRVFAQIGGTLEQGDEVEYWGNPTGLADQYRRGYVTGTRGDLILIDAEGWKGDSGAGIFKAGRLVSVLSIAYSPPFTPFHLMGAFPLEFTPEQLATIT